MSVHKKAFRNNSNCHQNGNGHASYGQPNSDDDGKMKRIEEENFHLRRQLEKKDSTTNTFKQILTKLRTELDDIKDKNVQMEMEMINLKTDNERKVKIACRHHLHSRVLNKRMHEIQEKLRSSENMVVSVISENKKLKRKVSIEREEYDRILQRKKRKLEKKCEAIIELKNGLQKEREKCDVQNGKLLSACDKLDTTLNQLEICENKITEQNGLIEELKCKTNLLETVLQENQKLQKWCDQTEKLIENFEHANKKDKLEIAKLQKRCTKMKVKLNEKQGDVDTILEKRNQLFDFVRVVCAISQFGLVQDDSFLVENQLSKLVAHLKNMFRTGKFNNDRIQYQQASHSLSSSSPLASSLPRHVSNIGSVQHAEDVSRRKSRSTQGCDTGAIYFCKCGRIETSKLRLKVHIKQSSSNRHFKCSQCPNRFLHFGRLRNHLKEIHLMDDALNEFVTGCKFCGKMFETMETSRQHGISAHM